MKYPPIEGMASVCAGNTGKLLFYSEGDDVYDSTNTIMPHGRLSTQGLCNNTAQAAAIVKMPDNANKYYLFSLEGMTGGGNGLLYYSVVDMSLRGGLGDVDTNHMRILIDTGLSEGMVPVAGNQCNVWLLVHSRGMKSDLNSDGNLFKAFEITSSGIDSSPVLSHAGADSFYKTTPTAGYMSYVNGGMIKVSPDRSKITFNDFAPFSRGGLEMFDFDPNTGQVSNAMSIDSSMYIKDFSQRMYHYGVCFSPDGTKLYTNFNEKGLFNQSPIGVVQYDISSGSIATIRASRIVLDSVNSTGDFRVAPDGKVYIALGPAYSISVINYPNLTGSACQYVPSIIGGVMAYYGLSNQIGLTLLDTASSTQTATTCADSMPLQPDPNGWDFIWSNGSYDNQIQATTGTYWVAYKSKGCQYHLDTFIVKAADFDTVTNTIEKGICGDSTVLQADTTGRDFIWNTGSTESHIQAARGYTYWVKYKYTNGEACQYHIDTFIVKQFDMPRPIINVNVHVLSTTIPYKAYQWMYEDTLIPGATQNTYTVTQNGNYRVIVSNDLGCVDTSAPYLVTNIGPEGIGKINRLADQISIYPNPASSTIYIDAPVTVNLSVYSVDGRMLKQVRKAKEISIRELADDVYFLNVYDQEGNLLKVEKIIKMP